MLVRLKAGSLEPIWTFHCETSCAKKHVISSWQQKRNERHIGFESKNYKSPTLIQIYLETYNHQTQCKYF